MNIYKRVHILYLPENKINKKIEWSFPYSDDDVRIVEDFHSLDLSALSEQEKHRITQLVIELPRYGLVRTDSADPVLGLVVVSLKRK